MLTHQRASVVVCILACIFIVIGVIYLRPAEQLEKVVDNDTEAVDTAVRSVPRVLKASNEFDMPGIPSSFNQAQIEGAMVLKSVIHWYNQDKDDMSNYFLEFLKFENKFSNMFEFNILITDENYNILADSSDDDGIPFPVSDDSINLRDELLEIFSHFDKSEFDELEKSTLAKLDKFIVSPQDRNNKWLTFFLVTAEKLPVGQIGVLGSLMKYNLLGVWHDNKFFVTNFKTRMPVYWHLKDSIEDWNDAVNYSDHVSGMNISVSPYPSFVDDEIKLVVTVSISDGGEYFKDSNLILNLNKDKHQDVYLFVSLLTDDGSMTSTNYTLYKLNKVVDKDIWTIEIPVLIDKHYLLEGCSILQVQIRNDTAEDSVFPVHAYVCKSISF